MTIFIAAGGTGGHVFPALAVADALLAQQQTVHFIADQRTAALLPPDLPQTILDIPPPSAGKLKQIRGILKAVVLCGKLFKTIKPSYVACFGGYPALPAGLAAKARGVPLLIHEQNAVMGRTNRLLAPMATHVALSYQDTQHAPKHFVFTGNPVRTGIHPIPYPAMEGTLKILVTGGSLGATIFSDVVPEAFALMEDDQRQRFEITQQCRVEDINRVRQRYESLNMRVALAPFFEDLPQKMGESHLVVCRAGASTLAELATIGRPAVLVPYPHAAHNHQYENAIRSQGVVVIEQARFTAAWLADCLNTLDLLEMQNDCQFTQGGAVARMIASLMPS